MLCRESYQTILVAALFNNILLEHVANILKYRLCFFLDFYFVGHHTHELEEYACGLPVDTCNSCKVVLTLVDYFLLFIAELKQITFLN